MDKSPALENFMNKMAVMQGKGQPKMSATTMKIGSGGLEKRIANNERKITAIKNIFKSQKIDIGDKLSPSKITIETLQEQVNENNKLLIKLGDAMSLDYNQRLKEEKWHLFAPAPGNGITLSDGTLVIPTQGRDAEGVPFSNLIWSEDHGKNWTVSKPARNNTTECAVVELSDGSLMLNMRDNRNRSDKTDTNGRAVSVTKDRGKTWSVHSSDHGTLPEPVCMASLLSHELRDGRRVLFFSNPNSKHRRENMTVRMSLDQGKTWPRSILLDRKGGAYSSISMVDEDTLGILYESSLANLVFQKIKLSEFGL